MRRPFPKRSPIKALRPLDRQPCEFVLTAALAHGRLAQVGRGQDVLSAAVTPDGPSTGTCGRNDEEATEALTRRIDSHRGDDRLDVHARGLLQETPARALLTPAEGVGIDLDLGAAVAAAQPQEQAPPRWNRRMTYDFDRHEATKPLAPEVSRALYMRLPKPRAARVLLLLTGEAAARLREPFAQQVPANRQLGSAVAPALPPPGRLVSTLRHAVQNGKPPEPGARQVHERLPAPSASARHRAPGHEPSHPNRRRPAAVTPTEPAANRRCGPGLVGESD